MKNSINKKIFIFIIILIVLNLGTMKTYGITDMDSLTNINNTFDLDNTIDVDNSIIDNDNTDEKQEEKISVSYSSHIQDIGWENDFLKKDGETSGTSGQALRLEAMKIKLNSSEIGIKYQTHIQDIGWQDWKENGEMSGTSGQSKRLEAISIKLQNTKKYSVMYRVHVQDIGWQEWKYDGQIAGTEGKHLRLEAIEIKIVDKIKLTPHIQYTTHIQDIGWQGLKTDGTLSGTSGQSKRLEGIKITISNFDEDVKIKYQTHIQDIGWQDWKENGEMSGTSGKALRLEAIKIKLEGTDEYSVMYRTHIQDIGWQEWCYDGEASGTFGLSKRLEAIEIKIVPKITEQKTRIHIDSPVVKNLENTTQKIKGWTMTNIENTKLQILIDDEKIDLTNLSRTEREDVLNEIKGYGDENTFNKNPGFEINVDLSSYSLGKHIIEIQVLDENEKILKQSKQEINIRQKISYSMGTYGKTGLKEKGDSRGTDLKYYKYGNGPNVFFATFAIHGYEDLWSKDGQELVTIANNFYEQLKNSNDYDLSDKWTIYIFPGVNLDGLNYGTTNNGPGRTTLYSQATGNKGIDLNRCWQIDDTYTIFTDDRNFNGTEGFQAYEAQYLRDFLLENKSENGQTILVDLHGWTQQVIGDNEICSYYSKQFPENDKSSVGRYGTGYLINWARTYLGSNTNIAKSALIELPHQGVKGHQSVIDKNFSNRYIQATIDMLKNISVKSNITNKSDITLYSLNTENIVNTKYEVAFAGMIKNHTPKKEEVQEIVKSNRPKENGIWIEENSRNKILDLFNNEAITNSKYFIDENGYLQIEEKNCQTDFDIIVEKTINGNKQYILDISSVCYIIDEITNEILDYNFENMDKYQVCEYFEDNYNKIIFINQNTYNQLENSEILSALIKLF